MQQVCPDMPRAEAEKLVSYGRVKEYPANVTLCHEGSVEDTFYIILSGRVKVSKRINDIEERFLKFLGEGEFFGELALIHDAPRTATVVTEEHTRVLEIKKSAFDEVLKSSTSLSLAMVREVSRRLRENDEMAVEDLRLRAGELAAAYQKLAEQEVARRQFLTTIAHELRTPLTAANGFVQAIRSGMLQGESKEQALEAVHRNLQRITTLVNDILFLQELDLIIPEFQSVSIEKVLQEAVDEMREKAEVNDVRLNLSVAPDLPLVQGDARSLERAFTALLDNAIKFSLDGGDVDIVARREGQDKVAVEVRDHGVGIPPERIDHIFDRYYRMDSYKGHLFEGAGLGLPIARQVIEQHQGKIQVESKLGIGSTFTVILPVEQK